MRRHGFGSALAVALASLAVLPGWCAEARPLESVGFEQARGAAREVVTALVERSAVPGVAVSVAVDGKIVWSEGFGLADLEKRVPVAGATRFGIGSVSKSLTMALVARLADEGRLDLDTPIERWLPEFPHKGKGITIRLVGGHLSGLGDSFDASARLGTAHYDTTAEALPHILKEPLLYEPRARHNYTTGPYTLVAGVIEKTAGGDFRTLMSDRVLAPLRMTKTVPNDRRAIVADRTCFYVLDDATKRPVNAPYFDPSYKWAGAGYLATADDLARFGTALLRGPFLSDRMRGEIFRPLATASGENTGFALGWRVARDGAGRRVIFQPGGGYGISSIVALYPDSGLVVVLLSNLTGAPVGEAVEPIADAFVGRSTTPGAPRS